MEVFGSVGFRIFLGLGFRWGSFVGGGFRGFVEVVFIVNIFIWYRFGVYLGGGGGEWRLWLGSKLFLVFWFCFGCRVLGFF